MAQIKKSNSGGTRLEIRKFIKGSNKERIGFRVVQIAKSRLPGECLRLRKQALDASRLEIIKFIREVIRK